MNDKYKSFASWNPNENEFPYDKSVIKKQGFRLRARLDKRNPDVKLLCSNLKKENKEVKLIDIEPENEFVDIWYKSL